MKKLLKNPKSSSVFRRRSSKQSSPATTPQKGDGTKETDSAAADDTPSISTASSSLAPVTDEEPPSPLEGEDKQAAAGANANDTQAPASPVKSKAKDPSNPTSPTTPRAPLESTLPPFNDNNINAPSSATNDPSTLPQLPSPTKPTPPTAQPQQQSPSWILTALASGTCAALSATFAKLSTTTSLTHTLANQISTRIALAPQHTEYALRGSFLGLNLAFNAAMWTLFTIALARGSSSTRVSLVNTTANFVGTALLGWAVFSEKLGGMWWVGAGLLVVGNVILGRGRGGGGDVSEEKKTN